MNNSLLFFISLFISSIVLFNIFLILLDRKIKKLENKIIFLFERRTNIVPSLYEITKHYFNKHTEVFYQILHLRKREFSNYNDSFQERFNIEIQIHHELNFIFKVIHQHKKIKKESKYLLIEDLFLENSLEIGKKIDLYKNIIKKINFLLSFKNFTILGLFIDIKKRNEI